MTLAHVWTGIAGRAGLCAGKELVRPVEQPVVASPRGLPATGQTDILFLNHVSSMLRKSSNPECISWKSQAKPGV